MPTVAPNKFNDFTEQLARGVHAFGSHTFKLALTNTAPSPTATGIASITQIAATGGYLSGGYTLTGVTVAETSGVTKITITDAVITAAGGSVGPFRYAVLYNASATSPAGALVQWYDYGESITLSDTETITIDFDATAGVLTVS